MRKSFFIIKGIILILVNSLCLELSASNKGNDKEDQNQGTYWYIQPMYHSGFHPSGTNYLQEIFANGFSAFELRMGVQSTGRHLWQQLHNYPLYGAGFYFGDLGGKTANSVIGKPTSLFFYYSEPWVRFGKFSLHTDLSLGLSFNFNPYHHEINPYQDVIGSRINVHFNLSFLLYFQLTERLDVNLGYGLTHFSNGRIHTPQKGVNTLGFNAGVKYNFNPVRIDNKDLDPDYKPPVRPVFYSDTKPPFKAHHEIQIMGAVGTVQAERQIGEPQGPRYFTSSFTADYAYHFARKMNVTGGFDVLYDGSLAETFAGVPFDQVTTFQKMEFAAHIGYQYLINRVTLLMNFALYMHKETPDRGFFFMRTGGRVAITDHWAINITLKTRNGGVADWVEWGAVHTIKLGKNNS